MAVSAKYIRRGMLRRPAPPRCRSTWRHFSLARKAFSPINIVTAAQAIAFAPSNSCPINAAPTRIDAAADAKRCRFTSARPLIGGHFPPASARPPAGSPQSRARR